MKFLVERIGSDWPEKTLIIIRQNLWKFLLCKMGKILFFSQLKPCLVLLDLYFPMKFYSALTIFSVVASFFIEI